MSTDSDRATARSITRRPRPTAAARRPASGAGRAAGTPGRHDRSELGASAAAGCGRGGLPAVDGGVAAAPAVNQLLAAGWQDTVLAGIADTYHNDSVLKPIGANVASMFARFAERGVHEWAEVDGDLTLEWCWSPVRRKDGTLRGPSSNTAGNRQQTARTVFRQAAKLGAQVDPATAAGERIKRTNSYASARPLTDRQLQRVCAAAETATAVSRRPVPVALSLAGASAEEAAAVRVQDIDLDAATVAFVGPCARVCALDEWSVRVIARYLRANPDTAPHERLCVKADTLPQSATQSVSIRLWIIIKDAGFASRCGISPRSIRLTAARKVFERDGIVAAARFLGSPSLDHTAELLGHDWQHHNHAAAAGVAACRGPGDG